MISSHDWQFNQHMTFEEMKADLMTLESTVINTDATLVVLDAEGVCFTRAWCLKEHHTAIMAGGDGPVGRLEILPYCLEVGNARKVRCLSQEMHHSAAPMILCDSILMCGCCGCSLWASGSQDDARH